MTSLAVELPAKRRRTGVWSGMAASTEGRAGLGLAALILFIVIFGPLLAPHSPSQISGVDLAGASGSHLLGTDELGRDVFSRFLNGGRTVLLAPLAATTLAFLVGGGLAMFGVFRGGWLDTGTSRLFDLFIALPGLLLVMVVITRVGTSFIAILLVVAVNFAPRAGRIVRGATQTVVGNDYVAAARLRGERTSWILMHELLPNAAPVIIANFCLYLTYSVVFVSTLSFLGLGAQPPSSDWGLMVSQSRAFIQVNPWATIAPAAGIASMAVAFTLIGDAMIRQVSRTIKRGGGDL